MILPTKHFILIAKKRNVMADYWSRILLEAGHNAIVSNTSYDDVLEAVCIHSPTILLIEASFDHDQGFELARQAKLIYPLLRCIVSMPDAPAYYAQAVQTDVSGYLPDDLDNPAEMIECLDQVSQGYRYISQNFRITISLPSDRYKRLATRIQDS